MKVQVARSFVDKERGAPHNRGSIYESNDMKRIVELQKAGFLASIPAVAVDSTEDVPWIAGKQLTGDTGTATSPTVTEPPTADGANPTTEALASGSAAAATTIAEVVPAVVSEQPATVTDDEAAEAVNGEQQAFVLSTESAATAGEQSAIGGTGRVETVADGAAEGAATKPGRAAKKE